MLLCSGTLRAQLEISEFMARNGTSLADANRAYPDWIELHNTSGADLSLDGWYLTDTPTNLTLWKLPAQMLSADGYVVLFASGKNRAPSVGPMHTNFKLSAGGGYLALVRPDGRTIASECGPSYPPQTTDISCGLNPLAGGPRFLFFERPTPSAPNMPGWPAVAGSVRFSHPGGTVVDPVALTLTTTEPGGAIWYTLDGSLPSTNSLPYTGPITVDRTLRIRARVVRDGRVPGPVSGVSLTLISIPQRAFSSNLPLLLMDTHGAALAEGTRSTGYLTVIDPSQGRSSWTGPIAAQSRAGIEIRGSSSTQFPKKSYGLELLNEDGTDRAMELLGLPADSDWVLYAPYTDKSLIRDVLAYELSNRIGRYAPQTRLVELYVNRSGTVDTSDYLGVYVLVEKVKGGDDRVDISEVEAVDVAEPDITGGYILKKDRLDGNDAQFTTQRGQALGLEWPRSRDLTTNQTVWIRTFMNRFETALYGSRSRDPVAGYAGYIDPDSFVDHHWLVEVAKNIDGFRLSTFMHKDRGGRLNMGPIWDYNLSFGNADYLEGWNPAGWYYPQLDNSDYPWYRRLFEDPNFNQRYIDRWVSLRTNVLATDRVLSLIDGYTNLLAEAQDRNFKKWRILGTYVWPNSFIGATYRDEIGFLKQWVTQRLAWIDSTMVRWPGLSHSAGYYPEGVDVQITGSNAIYYTLDGTDPRSSGGGLSPSAFRYVGPVRIQSTTRLIARARSGTRWSPRVDAAYAVTVPDLRITELMYHPPDPEPGSPFDDEEFEFVELRNTGSVPIPLAGFVLSGGIDYTIPATAGDLWPGENIAVARNLDALVSRHGTGLRVVGPYSGHLANSGDTVVLTGPLGEPILNFTYSDRWQPATDGPGYSLTRRNPAGPVSDWNLASAWDRSVVAGGTPGRNDVPESDLSRVTLRWVQDSGSPRLTLQFDAAAGQTYGVQSAFGLQQASWTLWTNLPPPPSSGPLTVELPVESETSRVFRVVTPRIP